jgi:predicted NBD/HSP70 family sugar kinase
VSLAQRVGMKAPLTPKKVFAAARKGDERAVTVVDLVAERIALSVSAVVSVVDPELVILGCGIGRIGDLLLEPVRRSSPSSRRPIQGVETSALGRRQRSTARSRRRSKPHTIDCSYAGDERKMLSGGESRAGDGGER